jgi:hypothetical protein
VSSPLLPHFLLKIKYTSWIPTAWVRKFIFEGEEKVEGQAYVNVILPVEMENVSFG